MSRDLRALSLEWEEQTGYDSIDTVERVYPRTKSGAYVCVHPGCSFARRDPVKIWRHTHTGHGRNDLPPEVRGGN